MKSLSTFPFISYLILIVSDFLCQAYPLLAYQAANSFSVAFETDGLNYFNAFLKSSNLIALISLVSLIAINYSVVSSLTGDIAASLITACKSEHE